MPVASAAQVHDLLGGHGGHDIVIILEPLIAASVHPANVVAGISVPAFVSDHSDQLVVAVGEAGAVLAVENAVLLLAGLLALLLLFQRHLLGCVFGLHFSDFDLHFAARLQRHLDLGRAELVDIEHHGEAHLAQQLRLRGIRAAHVALLLPVEPHEVHCQVFRLTEPRHPTMESISLFFVNAASLPSSSTCFSTLPVKLYRYKRSELTTRTPSARWLMGLS